MKRLITICFLALLVTQGLAQATVRTVPSRTYPNIRSAMTAAVNGDVIELKPGVFEGPDNKNLIFGGKVITIKSQYFDPCNPNQTLIDGTIIDCQGLGRAFQFKDYEGPDSKIMGLTIKNSYATGPRGTKAGQSCEGPFLCLDDPNQAPPGDNISGNGFGGAIVCGNPPSGAQHASPTIRNCVFMNCTVTGAVGGDGADGIDAGPPPACHPTNGQYGGNGGNGDGYGFGGAIACKTGSSSSVGSNPVIIACVFKNNLARGGIGGNGGNGGDAIGSGLQSGGGNGGNGIGSGQGGAVYADAKSSPKLIGCTFINNTGIGGIGGAPGVGGNGAPRTGCPGWVEGSPGSGSAPSSVSGGAVYYTGSGYPVELTSCSFTSNRTAVYVGAGRNAAITQCDFIDNLAGALYCGSNSTVNIAGIPARKSVFRGNSAIQYGGAIYVDNSDSGSITIENCIFENNSAYDDGGAIECRSDLNVTDSSFSGNVADSDNDDYGYGGAIDVYNNKKSIINLTRSTFNGNHAADGGGFSTSSFDGNFVDCVFVNNDAKSGGALDLDNGDFQIIGSFISSNRATDGTGGAINYSLPDATAIISDSIISKNSAEGAGMGGAIYFNGSASDTHSVFNCLITENSAGNKGGGIYCHIASPEIMNCTFSDNSAAGSGGAVLADAGSEPTIINSIFNRCSSHAIHETYQSGNAVARYNLFYGNPNGSYYDAGTNKVYDGPTGPNGVGNIPGGSNNLYGDPLFVTDILGQFYLRQMPAQPPPTSPAVNNGSSLAADLGLDTDTTSTEEEDDTGIVDIGYHYIKSDTTPAFYLDTGVVDNQGGAIAPPDGSFPAGAIVMLVATPDYGFRVKKWTGTNDDSSTANINAVSMLSDKIVTVEFEKYLLRLDTSVVGGVGGTIEPPSGNYYTKGSVVTLTAIPNSGWRIKKWTGTNNDSSTSNTNTVTMDTDKAVSVEFELFRTLTVGPDCDYPTIHQAIAAAKTGDTVLVSPGVWYGPQTDINKSITIRSIDPNHPENTVIDGTEYIERMLYFGPDADGTVLNGFTIRGCRYRGGQMDEPEDPRRDGLDGWPLEGGAVYIEMGSSPIIKNCIIKDNSITGAHASNGAAASATANAGKGGWAGWARGGGVFCAPSSAAMFINCQIVDNTAIGGNGGAGGTDSEETRPNYGGNWSRDGTPEAPVLFLDSYLTYLKDVTDRPLFKMWMWDYGYYYSNYYPWLHQNYDDFSRSRYLGWPDYYYTYYGDYRWFSGYGGGVYCDINSQITFINCTINGNRTQGGLSGAGGSWTAHGGDNDMEPEIPYQIPSYGGGVYCAAGSTVKFSGCAITNNVAVRPTPDQKPYYHLDPYLGHGGGIAAEDTATVIIENSLIRGNEAAVGGGVWWTQANPKISSTSFTGNKAYEGGGLYGIKGTATVSNSLITGNEAFGKVTDPNGELNDPNLYDPNSTYYLPGNGGGIHCNAAVVKIADCNISANTAGKSGGGAYFVGENLNHSVLKNCLLTYNTAGKEGGGMSNTNFYKLDVSICTIANNTVTGGQDPNYNYGGGGVSCSDRADTDITHSIIWGNIGEFGPQMAVRRGVGIATVDVNYCDVKGGAAGVYIENGCIMNWYDANNLNGTSLDNPLFTGSYYLDQILAGQAKNSPCVNAGDDTNPAHDALYYGMYKHTTRTDKAIDTGLLDLGYHHILITDLIGDFDFDGDVDSFDWKIFTDHWLDTGCIFPEWCNETDLNQDGVVNFNDYTIFARHYKETETEAPQPNPMTWAIVPQSTGVGQSAITMRATKAVDNSGSPVQYQFKEVTGNPGGNDSSWQSDANYTDSGLSASTKYGYKVKARDTSNYTETQWSFIGYAVPGEVPEDTAPPSPNPMTWTTGPNATSSTTIKMIATTATDSSGVEYLFDCLTTGGHDSVWQNSPTYTDVNLTPSTAYTYKVKARDKSANHNENSWSTSLSATTLSGGEPNQPVNDTDPPTPNQAQWNVRPTRNEISGVIYMSAVVATDVSPPVQYYFDCINGSGLDSGWQLSEVYTYTHTSNCVYVVRTRDALGNVGQNSEPWYTGD